MKTRTIDVFIHKNNLNYLDEEPLYNSPWTYFRSKDNEHTVKAKLVIELPKQKVLVSPDEFESKYREAYGFDSDYEFSKGGSFSQLYKVIFGENYEG